MQGGTSVTLFSGQKRNHELLMIEGELESWLGLENSPVERQADSKSQQ